MRKEQKANYPESARGAAALLVRMVLEDGAYTNIALNQYLRGSRLSDLDRRLATELVYGTVKASGTLDWYLARASAVHWIRWPVIFWRYCASAPTSCCI